MLFKYQQNSENIMEKMVFLTERSYIASDLTEVCDNFIEVNFKFLPKKNGVSQKIIINKSNLT